MKGDDGNGVSWRRLQARNFYLEVVNNSVPPIYERSLRTEVAPHDRNYLSNGASDSNSRTTC